MCAIAMTAVTSLAADGAWATGYYPAGWGANGSGQLGTGTTTKSNVPVPVREVSEVTAIASGGDHTLALLANGTVEAWGANESGQLGNGTTTGSSTAVTVKELSEVVAISAAPGYSLALLSSGKVMSWGANSVGQLGDGTTTSSSVPVEVKELTEASAISAAPEHALAVLKSGAVMDWGANESGDLGTGGGYSGKSTVPVEVSELTEAAAVSGGDGYSVALLKGGTVRAWGENAFGQLGTGSPEGPSVCTREVGFIKQIEYYGCSDKPVAVTGLSGVSAIAAGGDHVLALLSGGGVKSWGSNYAGELGDGSTTGPSSCWIDSEVEFGIVIGLPGPCSPSPLAVTSLSGAVAIGAGEYHSLALLSAGTVKAWGDNGFGQLGDGAGEFGYTGTPTSVSGLAEVAAIAAGGDDSFSIGAPLPTIGSISPSSGPASGGTSVEITGTNLSSTTSVKFGSTNATSFTVHSSTSLTAVAPAHKPGTVDIVVGTSAGKSAPSASDRYTYLPETLEFGRCLKVGSGEGAYKNAACTEPGGTAKYAWHPGLERRSITILDTTETVEKVVKPKKVTFETVEKVKLICQSGGGGTGEISGPSTLGNLVLTFSGCELGGSKCSSAGAGEGEVKTSPLQASLGWRESEANTVGLAISPVALPGAFLEATCGSSTVVLDGGAIAAITPVDNMTAGFSVKFKQSKGKQSPESFQGEAAEVLSMSVAGGSFEQAGLGFDSLLNGEEEAEINTVV
jgi:alpha-tubulin suppressor-like RCC1 family protein